MLSTENESFNFKNKIGSYNEKWLEESKTKLLKQIDVEKRATLIMSGIEKQVKKNIKRCLYPLINYGVLSFTITSMQKIKFKILN